MLKKKNDANEPSSGQSPDQAQRGVLGAGPDGRTATEVQSERRFAKIPWEQPKMLGLRDGPAGRGCRAAKPEGRERRPHGRSFHFHLLRSPGTPEALGGYSTFSKPYKMKKQKITFPSRFSPLLDRADQVQGPHIRQLGIQGHSECTAPAPHLRPRPLLTRSAQTLFICFHFTLIGDHCAPSSGSVF